MTRNDRAVDDRAVAESRKARLAVVRGLNRLPVELLDALELILRDAKLGNETLGRFRRVVGRLATNRGAALRDRAMEQAARGRHRHDRRRLTAAARLTEDRDAIGIATEIRDVVLDPLQ